MFTLYFSDYIVNVFFFKVHDAASNKIVMQRQTPVICSNLLQGIRSKSKLFDQGLYFV